MRSLITGLSFSLAIASPKVDSLINKMSDEELVAQMIFVYHVSPSFLEEEKLGNVLVMQNMLKKPELLKSQLDTLSKWKIPSWTSIDQEGGKVNRIKKLKGHDHHPSATEMGTWLVDSVFQEAKRVGIVLQNHGLNLNLAPVLDPFYDSNGDSTFMAIEGRSFGDDSLALVKAEAFCDGLSFSKVGCVLKHFPGYDAKENSDHAVALSSADSTFLEANIKRFEKLTPKASAIMISSIRFGEKQPPAVFSKYWIERIRQLDPNIPIVTDDLWGMALRKWTYPKAKARTYPNKYWKRLIRSAFDAGNDLFMVTYPAKAVLIHKYILSWYRKDAKAKKQIKDSVRRILLSKEKQGLL